MITVLDNQSWAKELQTGNAQFVRTSGGILFIVSNVRADGTFAVLQSDPVPPQPGPGASFTEVATGNLGTSTIDFDPVVTYDEATGLLHIIGTKDNTSDNPALTDVVKFTYDTNTQTLTQAATAILTGTNIQSAYDLCILDNGIITGGGAGHKLVAVAANNPIYIENTPLFQAAVTNIAISASTLTVVTNNQFTAGQLIEFSGLASATFLNGAQVQVVTVSPTQFTALYFYQSIKEPHSIPVTPGPYTVVVDNVSSWESDVSVFFSANNVPLTRVASSPGPGQYSASLGTYTFNAADQGKGVLITYNQFYSSPDSGLATPVFTGQSLVAFELDASDVLVPNTISVLANSPERTGNAVNAVSVISPDGVNSEIYYESHPKLIAYKDQLFNIYEVDRGQTFFNELHTIPATPGPYTITANNVADWQADIGVVYDPSGTPLTKVVGAPNQGEYSVAAGVYTFNALDQAVNVVISYYVNTYTVSASALLTTIQARYTDDRLTVQQDLAGNRYLSQVYFTQFNHPYGMLGNAFLGVKPVNGTWLFHSTLGTITGGSVVQGSISMSQSGSLDYVYLLAPFDAEPTPANLPASYPLHIGTIDSNTMSFVDVPGFYNQQKFTWLRGSKSIIDDPSLWAAVGEQEKLTTVGSDVAAEVHVIPALAPYALLVDYAASFWQNISVVDNSGSTPVTFTAVINNPEQGQYVNQPNGLYTFNAADASVGITGVDLTSNQLTVTGSNITNLVHGQKILFEGLTTKTYLNGQTVTVTAIDLEHSTFSANFTHADDPEAAETGLAGKPIAFSYTYVNSITPVYVSLFNVPPVAALTPTLVNPAYRAHAYTFDATSAVDADQDPLQFVWTVGGTTDSRVKDVLVTATNGLATVVVPRSIGGAPLTFNLGVAIIDLQADHVTPRHPAIPVTNVAVNGSGVVTVDANTTLAPGETVMLYDIALAPPSGSSFSSVSSGVSASITNISLVGNVLTVTANNNFGAGQQIEFSGLTYFTYLNGQSVTVISATATQFTAAFTHADDSSADTGTALYPPVTTYYTQITYVNAFGETAASVEDFVSIAAGDVPVILSPAATGDATGWNVYIGLTSGSEQLQNTTPIAIGTDFTLPNIGVLTGTAVAPTDNTAFIAPVNDQVYTIATWSPTQFTTDPTALATLASTPVVGYVIPQYQFATAELDVPFNAVPTITFPSPEWVPGTVDTDATLATTLPRNTQIQITTQTISDPLTQFPVIITGMNDTDDAPTYLWEQTAGHAVSMSGTTTPILTFQTNGVDIHGETLSFRLTVDDGVNAPVQVSCTMAVDAYNFSGLDSKKISRSLWTEQDIITNIEIVSNVLTVTADNTLVVGQAVTLTGLTTATFLEGKTVTVTAATATDFTADFTWSDYTSAADTGFASANARISQRNSSQTWGTLDQSAIYSDLATIKRTSVLDGTDRYIVISQHSVLVYGGINPTTILLRKLFTPESTMIVDAVHTEDDTTLVIDDNFGLFRYSDAPLINTDNPDTIFDLSTLSPMVFNKIFATYSYGNIRVLALSGPDGCMLIQMANDTMEIQGILELTTVSNLVAGSNNVQFVRLSNVENLRSGKVLLGTVTNTVATVTAVSISNNGLIVTCENTFKVGDVITFSGFLGATAFLNGLTVTAIQAQSNQFIASIDHADLTTTATTATSLATAQNEGKTYETLIDLPHGQIIGTWDASKLRNQFVNTGEILFEPQSSYSGRPVPPVQGIPTGTVSPNPQVKIVWTQERPDLVNSYNVEYATQTSTSVIVPASLTYATATVFGSDIGVLDVASLASITQVSITSNVLTLTAVNDYGVGDQVNLSGFSTATFLNGQTVTVVSSSGVDFTANFTHADLAPTADFGVGSKTINMTLTPVSSNPGPGEYAVTAGGLYTFNIAQINDQLVITFRSNFTVLAKANSGAIQTLTIPLAPNTYAFRLQAFSNDGASDYSNIQTITY